MAIQNSFPKDEKQVVDSALSTTSTNPVQNAIITTQINSINSTLSNKADTSAVLTKTNTTAFTPTANYHPATKAYVDSKAGEAPIYSVTNRVLAAGESLVFINTATLQGAYKLKMVLRDDSGVSYDSCPNIYLRAGDPSSSRWPISGYIYQYAFDTTITKSGNLFYNGDYKDYGRFVFWDESYRDAIVVEFCFCFGGQTYYSYGYSSECDIRGEMIGAEGKLKTIGGSMTATTDSGGFSKIELMAGSASTTILSAQLYKIS